MSQLALNDQVRNLEEHLLRLPQVDFKTQMFAHGGMGIRTIFIPAGTALTGALTNLANLCIVSGDIEVTTDEGMKRLTGFHVLPASAGYKRAGFAHADTWWSTVWRTDLTDSRQMEDEMTGDVLQSRRDGLVYMQPRLEK